MLFKNVLLINNSVNNYLALKKNAEENNTLVFDYNSSNNLSEIYSLVENENINNSITNLGIICHGETGSLEITNNISVNIDTLKNNIEIQIFFKNISNLLVDNGRIDIITCNFIKKGLRQRTYKQNNVRVRLDKNLENRKTKKRPQCPNT